MKEIPILFSTPMVQAILEGRKTMTRRIHGLERMNEDPEIWKPYKGDLFIDKKGRLNQKFFNVNVHSDHAVCSYGQPGDVLWVREKFACTLGKYEPETTYSYFADSFHWSFFPEDKTNSETACQWHDDDLAKEVAWKPSIHMPKTAARIWLQVEEIRVERLQDIIKEDAIAEGILKEDQHYHDYNNAVPCLGAISSFQSLWESINGGVESWLANPWVWVVKFKVLSTTGKPTT